MKTLTEQELKVSGIEALNKALGASGALKFLSLLHREPTDYVDVSRRLYEGQTIDDICERAKKMWKAKRG